MKEIYKNPLVRVVTVEIRHQVCQGSDLEKMKGNLLGGGDDLDS